MSQLPTMAPDTDIATLHIRCGSDICDKLKAAGFTGDFLEFSDPYCQGPVVPGSDLVGIRARFIADACGLPPADVAARLQAAETALARSADDYPRLVLWFEHDSYDQLILARILAGLAARVLIPDVQLICIDRFPGVGPFYGLGQLPPAALRTLWDVERRAVSEEQLQLGAAAWNALRAPSPEALHRLMAAGTPALPIMAGALRRHLQELPWTGDGLNLTQRLALQALRDGPRTAAQVFHATQHGTDPLPFMGDRLFRAVLRDMARAGEPPLTLADLGSWPENVLALTQTGVALLEGRADWMALDPRERWVGGVKIASASPAWRWDPAGGVRLA